MTVRYTTMLGWLEDWIDNLAQMGPPGVELFEKSLVLMALTITKQTKVEEVPMVWMLAEDFDAVQALQASLHRAEKAMTFDQQRNFAEAWRLLLEHAVR